MKGHSCPLLNRMLTHRAVRMLCFARPAIGNWSAACKRKGPLRSQSGTPRHGDLARDTAAWSQGDEDLTPSEEDPERVLPAEADNVLRPEVWRRKDRRILLGVSHVSDDPARHRLFKIRAVYDRWANGWVAQVAEQNRNEQPGTWTTEQGTDGTGLNAFPTAAACLGDAVETLLILVDREA